MTYRLVKRGVIRFDSERDPEEGRKISPDMSGADWREYLVWLQVPGNFPEPI